MANRVVPHRGESFAALNEIWWTDKFDGQKPCMRPGDVMALHAPYATIIWDYNRENRGNRGENRDRENQTK
jgi:hypothetical protein